MFEEDDPGTKVRAVANDLMGVPEGLSPSWCVASPPMGWERNAADEETGGRVYGDSPGDNAEDDVSFGCEDEFPPKEKAPMAEFRPKAEDPLDPCRACAPPILPTPPPFPPVAP